MGKRSRKSRRKAVKRLYRYVKNFFAAISWLIGFILAAIELWDRFFG